MIEKWTGQTDGLSGMSEGYFARDKTSDPPLSPNRFAGNVSRYCGFIVLFQPLFWGFCCEPYAVHAVRSASSRSASGAYCI
jgi:hypothetical protein